MDSIEVYIYIIIGLLGVAYPILLQVVARLDEKYCSDIIVELFNKEKASKAFKFFLILSLILVIIWSLRLPPLISIKGFDFFIENSASILLAISCIILVVSFFKFVNKILTYYTPIKFIPYLIKQHNNQTQNIEYFTALSDLLLLFIRTKQTNYSKTLADFFYLAFKNIRDKTFNKPVVYPAIYYEIVHKAIEELGIVKEKRNYLLEHRTSGGIWLLGEFEGKTISEETYSWLWRNLLTSVHYEQDDLIINHWEACHQYFVYNLPQIYAEYDYSKQNIQVSNKSAVVNRNKERVRFIEFHYALGGLLTYNKRYSCIQSLFSHTQTQPPKYELLPESMYEVFSFYFKVKDPYERNFSIISSLYPFPKVSGMSSDYVIKKWICSYMAILFLRQYTIIPYLITMEPLSLPQPPDTQSEIKEWIDGIDFFKILVEDHLKNKELLNSLNLHFITESWCKENNKPFPLDFIKNFKENLEKVYHENALNLEISNKKINQFQISTREIIEPVFAELKTVSNNSILDESNVKKWYANGESMIQSKDAFAENSEIHYLNFDTCLASTIKTKMNDALVETFYYSKTKTYLIKQEDFFKAIKKLEIDDSHLILCVGIHLDYYINVLKISELKTDKFHSTDIKCFNASKLVNPSIFVIKKSDLPQISSVQIPKDYIEKYSPTKISDSLELYSSVIDLNKTSETIFNELKQNKNDDELRKSVLLQVAISIEYKWKEHVELIHIQQYSEYHQKGIVNKLEEIEPMNREKPSS